MADDSTLQLQQWIDRLKAGDPAARNALVNHACARLRRLTQAVLKDFRRVRAFEESGDVLNNAVPRLLRALEAAPPDTVAHFFRLAAQQVRRELIDLCRHYYGPAGPGAHPAVPLHEVGSGDTAEATTPSDSSHEPAKLARWSEFHDQAGRLPPEEQEVFDLIWYQGLSLAEAAEVLSISYATVKRRWLAARLYLRQALDEGARPA